MTLESRIKQLEDRRGTPIEPEDLAGMTAQEKYLAMLKQPLRPAHRSSRSLAKLKKLTPQEAYLRALHGPSKSESKSRG